MTWAMSSGLGQVAKSASGIALRFAGVSMILGKIEFARTPVRPFGAVLRRRTAAFPQWLGGEDRASGGGTRVASSVSRAHPKGLR